MELYEFAMGGIPVKNITRSCNRGEKLSALTYSRTITAKSYFHLIFSHMANVEIHFKARETRRLNHQDFKDSESGNFNTRSFIGAATFFYQGSF